MNIKLALTVSLSAVFLAACGDDVKSVEWYMEHEEEQMAMLEKCERLTLAEFSADKNCAHANAAMIEADNNKSDFFDLRN